MMNLPFSAEQFIGVFRDYNLAVWPMQIVMYLAALFIVIYTFKKTKSSDRIVSLVLAVMWLWNGLVYHIMSFTTINKAAFIFGAFFIVQGLLFLWCAVKDNIRYATNQKSYQVMGGLLILYAAVIYPIIGTLLGHGYPHLPLLGIAPCPTTIFTMGLLLLAAQSLPLKVIWIPFIWSLIGFNAALALGIKEDIGLLAAGLITMVMIIYSKSINRKSSQSV